MAILIRTKDGRTISTRLAEDPATPGGFKVLIDPAGNVFRHADVERIIEFPEGMAAELNRNFWMEPCYFD